MLFHDIERIAQFAAWGIFIGCSGVAVVWICATLHEIHLDLKKLNSTIAQKQLEIPSPLWVRDWQDK